MHDSRKVENPMTKKVVLPHVSNEARTYRLVDVQEIEEFGEKDAVEAFALVEGINLRRLQRLYGGTPSDQAGTYLL